MEEILSLLLIESLKTGIDILAQAGFKDRVKDLLDRLTGAHEKKLQQAFTQAYQKAVESGGDEALKPLLKHQPFQEEIVTALLDPVTGFNVDAAREAWGEKLPEHAPALRRFFSALKKTLTGDETWGPLLERYQDLRMEEAVQQGVAQQGLPVTEREVVRQAWVKVEMNVKGDWVQGDKKETMIGSITAQPNSTVNIADQITQNYFNVDLVEQEQKRQAQARLHYLERLSRSCQSLPLAALGGEEGADEDITLDQVYIDLDTTTRVPVENEKKSKKARAAR
jgi:hypothetical protein